MSIYRLLFCFETSSIYSFNWILMQWPQETRGSAHWACIAHLTIEWNWSKFQREIINTLKNSSHLEWRVGLSDTILKGTHPGTISLHRCFLPSLAPFGQAVSEEKIFLRLANQKEELILAAMFVGRMEPNEEA